MLLASERDRRHRQAVDTMSEAAVVVDPPDFLSFRRRDLFIFFKCIVMKLNNSRFLGYLFDEYEDVSAARASAPIFTNWSD